MSEQEQQPDEDKTPSARNAPAEPEAKRAVSKGVLLILVVILFSLIWHFLADRHTPYTSQARVQGFVVGVAPKVAGLVTKVHVVNNHEVEEGQPLFEIDKASYEIALSKAQSDLQSAQAQVGAGSAGIESAEASLRAAKANAIQARQEADRLERLYKEDPGTISVRRLEAARTSREEAQAKVSGAQAEVQRAVQQQGGNDDNNSQLKSARSAVQKAQLDLENTVVRASSRGVITDLRADVGQFAGAGSPVMTLIAIRDVWIDAEYTENNLGHLKVGTPVDIVLDALPGRVFTGTIKSIGLGISASNSPPAGTLPTIQNDRDWLRQAQRFPVVVAFDSEHLKTIVPQLRIGGQADVMAYTEGHWLLRTLGKAYIRMMSWFSYAY